MTPDTDERRYITRGGAEIIVRRYIRHEAWVLDAKMHDHDRDNARRIARPA